MQFAQYSCSSFPESTCIPLESLLYELHFDQYFSLLQQLKKQRDKLKQYQKRIELSLVKERELAKKCLAMGRKE